MIKIEDFNSNLHNNLNGGQNVNNFGAKTKPEQSPEDFSKNRNLQYDEISPKVPKLK